jgi:hypothetical protein
MPIFSEEEAETIVLDNTERISGEIVDVIGSNALVIELSFSQQKEWGKYVYIVSDQARLWGKGAYILVEYSAFKRPYDAEQYIQIVADGIHRETLDAKPIIYFYPEVPTVCSAKVTLDGRLTCTYPMHGADGWQNFVANSDGTLVFPDGKEYYALYWEGVQHAEWDFSQGFCVRGEDTVAFLEWALAAQGLTPREVNEFVVYWLPLMQENPYNVIAFQTEAYTDGAILDIEPAPDSLLRVFMAYYPSDTAVDMQPQTFTGFTRDGFAVVEWGGSRVERP